MGWMHKENACVEILEPMENKQANKVMALVRVVEL